MLTAGALLLPVAALVAPTAGLADPAEPTPTISQVKEQVDALYEQGEAAAERANDAQVVADAVRGQLDTLRANLAKLQQRLDTARAQTGVLAAAQYRSSGMSPALQLLLSDNPETFLSGASSVEQLTASQARAVGELSDRQAAVSAQERAIERETQRLDELTATLDAAKAEADAKLKAAQALLNRLTAEEKARLEALRAAQAASRARDTATGPADEPADPGDAGTTQPVVPPPPGGSARAKIAVAFAMAQIGKPYRYGGVGPGSYDCSGLTMASWRAAGVSLPHSSRAQYGMGTHVSRSQLQPGDLLFYYSPIHHVAIYIGNGQIVHASTYGVPVKIAPAFSMSYVGATRVG